MAKTFFRIKDPVSGGTHLLAGVLATFGLFALLQQARFHGTLKHQIAVSIFGVSMILLYAASSIHHLIPKSIRHAKLFRKIDHAMIFVLIAGTYTPICIIALGGALGWGLIASVWTLAIIGIGLKISGYPLSRKASTALYIGIGWNAVIALVPLLNVLSPKGFAWLVAGGVLYSIGGVIYALRRPDPIRDWFGFHEIFHLFVMAGSFCHYWTIFHFVK